MPGPGAWTRPYRDGWRVFLRRQSGARLEGTRVFKDKAEADHFAEEMRTEIEANRRTVGDAVAAYIDDMKAAGRRENTLSNLRRELRRLLGPLDGNPLASLTPRRAEAAYQAAIKTVGPGTQRLTLATGRAFGAWCAHRRRRWLRENPFQEVEAVAAHPDHRGESLRIDEARKLYEAAVGQAAGGDLGALAALVALVCSLRPSELAQIQVRDVDDGGRVLWVAGATLKTSNTRRRMEIADGTVGDLLAAGAKGRAADELLFRLVTRRGILENVKRVCNAALGRAVTPRELRRTFATLASRAGRSLDEVAFGMGHGADANARTARRHYIRQGATETGTSGRVVGLLKPISPDDSAEFTDPPDRQ